MNRKERRASGMKGSQSEKLIVHNAIDLARQLMEKKKKEEALELYEKILTFDPDNAIALYDLACDNLERGKLDLAEEKFMKILVQEPAHPGALAGMGSIRFDQGQRKEALTFAEKARKSGSDNHTILLRLSTLYRNAGMLDLAKELIYAALAIQPDDVGIYHNLQSLEKSTPADVEKLQAISKGKLTPRGKMVLNFTLGKACMDIGRADEAFWHYAEGNLMKRATYSYDPARQEAYVEHIIRIFNEKTVARLRGKSSITSDRPIFVIGMPRSGSTLTDQILSSHPDVGSVGEARFLPQCIPVFPNTKKEADFMKPGGASINRMFVKKMNARMLDVIGNRYLEKMEPYVGASKRTVDKMLFNFLWLGVIRLALPNAKIVHCVRDPIDIGLSIWGLLFADDMMWAYDQAEIARYYLSYNKLMDHWRKLFPGEFYEARYEDMIADQEGQTRKLLEFCNLPWDEHCLKFHESTRSVKTASVTQVRKPIYKDSVKKWKKHEKHLQIMVDTVAAEKPEILQ